MQADLRNGILPVMQDRSALVARIQEVLGRGDLNMRSWSVKAGLSQDFVRNVVRGKSEFPRFGNVIALAQAAGVSFTWLIGESDDPTPNPEVEGLADRQRIYEAALDMFTTLNRHGDGRLTNAQIETLAIEIAETSIRKDFASRARRLEHLKERVVALKEYHNPEKINGE